jgi:hypothetical protein
MKKTPDYAGKTRDPRNPPTKEEERDEAAASKKAKAEGSKQE